MAKPYSREIHMAMADLVESEAGYMQTSQPNHQPSLEQRAKMELEHRMEEKRLAKLKMIIQEKLKAANPADRITRA